MSAHIEFLINLCEKNVHLHEEGQLTLPKWEIFEKFGYTKEIQEVFDDLGGQGDFTKINWRRPTIELPRRAIVLDEAYDFNRYRTVSLRAPSYERITHISAPNYRRYSQQYESECLKSGINGPKWTNHQAEAIFGRSEAPGDLGLNGSAMWRMRAFQNFMLDLTTLVTPYPIVRISVYENLMVSGKLVQFRDLLRSRTADTERLVWQFIERKMIVNA